MSFNRKDLPPVGSSNFLPRVRETLQSYLGTNGNPMDRGLTVRDLADAGLVRVNPTFVSSGVGAPIAGAGPAVGSGGSGGTVVVVTGEPTTPPYVPDLTKPPAPTGFFVGAGLNTLQGGVNPATYTVGHGHDRCIVYGVTRGDSDPLPTFSNALEITRFTGSIFVYPTNAATRWHLWVTNLSKDGVESDPAGGLHGVSVKTGQDIPLLLGELNGLIGESELSPTVRGAITDAADTATAAASTADWLASNYVVRTTVSVDGRTLVGGFSLAGSSSQNQGPEIEFGVAANRFWVGTPQGAGVSAIRPFVVQTTDVTTPNGVVIPKGVYMDAAFILNLEAAVARLGQAWIQTAMIGDAQVNTAKIADASITDAKVSNLSAEKITTGQLSAARIDARGLSVRNQDGEVLLDASGSNIPPWVVSLENRIEPGALSFATPKDLFNRSFLRALKVDPATLSSRYTVGGGAIELAAASTEIWRVCFSSNLSLFTAEGQQGIENGDVQLEPNTAYTFEFRMVCRAATSTNATLRVSLDLPENCRFAANDGATVENTLPTTYVIGSVSATTTGGNPNNPQVLRAFVVTREFSGRAKLHLLAETAAVQLSLGTQIIANRLNRYVQPSVAIQPSATLRSPFTVNRNTPVPIQVASGQSYDYYAEIDTTIPTGTTEPIPGIEIASALSLVRSTSSPSIYFAFALIDTGDIGQRVRLVQHNLSQSVTSTFGGTSRTTTYKTAAFMFEYLSDPDPIELSRWQLSCTWNVVQAVPADDIETPALSGSLLVGVGETRYAEPVTAEGLYAADASAPRDQYAYLTFLCNRRVPGFVIIDFTFQPIFNSPYGDPWTIRLRVNRA